MAQLIVRNVDPAIVRCLKERARKHGISMEEEHRRVLKAVLSIDGDRLDFKAFLASCPDVGHDEVFERPAHASREVEL